VDDYRSWPFSMDATQPTGPAQLLVPDLLRLLNTRYDPNSEVGLHQREEVWLHSPVRLGERVRMEGRFVDKFVKRGKGYIVTDAEAVSLEDGRLLARHRSTEVARVPDGVVLGGSSASTPARRVKAEWPADRAPVSRASRGLAGGTPVLGPSKTLHQDQISVFSNVGAFWRTIHTDLERARLTGSDKTIAQGLMAASYVSELGASFFGEAWLHHGWMSLTFVQPMFPGDRVEVKAVVLDESDRQDSTRLELEVWVTNQDGVKTALGWVGAPPA
jgi:acyl dehydratase